MSSALTLLVRHTPEAGPVGWDDVIVGHDFGLVTPGELHTWIRLHACGGEAVRPPADRPVADRDLWAACSRLLGRIPLPGHRGWQRAQDRWRVALLKQALATCGSVDALAAAIEAIYDQVGCPEDMVGLWSHARARGGQAEVRLEALQTLLRRLAPALLPQAG